MNFREVEVFLAVAEHGTLQAAAATEHATKSSISQTIRRLEHELGLDLFHRDGDRFVLTSAGRTFLEPARALLRDVQAASDAVMEVAGVETGRLDIVTLPGDVGPIIGAIGRFRAAHPGVTVQVTEGENEEALADAIRHGRHELGVGHVSDTSLYDVQIDTSGLEVRTIGHDEICIVLPPSAGTGLPDPLPIRQLPDIPVIATPPDIVGRRVVESLMRRTDVQRRVAVVTGHRHMIIPLVVAGTGMAWTYLRDAEVAASLGAVVRRVEPTVTMPFSIMHRSASLSRAARQFLETLPTARLNYP
jgi:DNA-binding transcriptional LysR family regulator